MSQRKMLGEFSVDELVEELRARRGAADKAADETPIAPRDDLAEFDSESIYGFARAEQEVIYGVDDRRDLFQVEDAQVLDDADCVVALFAAGDIRDNGDGTSTLVTENFGERRNLCAQEPFREQPVGAFCSGFLVARQVIATAGHCVRENNVSQIRFVFGFRMRDAGHAEVVIDNAQIYAGTRLLGREEIGTGPDWALVEVDRPVPDHRIAQIRVDGLVDDNQALHVIGHPSGLPLKVADSSIVQDNSPQEFFIANLDTYGGNSGSPVFNSDNHQVEGILVRGERDFVPLGDCTVSMVCPANASGCRGEDCTRTSVFASLIATDDQ